MKNKRHYFNHRDIGENNHFNNYQKYSNLSRNYDQYLKKHNHNFSLPNRKNIGRNPNIFLSNELSTLLTSDDFFLKNNSSSNINNCNCYCHEIDKKLIENILKDTKICFNNINDNLFESCPNYPHIHWISNTNISLKKKYGNRLNRSADNVNNDFLAEKYMRFNKEFNEIKKQLENLELEEKERNNYIEELENKLFLNPRNEYNRIDSYMNKYNINYDKKYNSNYNNNYYYPNPKENYDNQNYRYRNLNNDDTKLNEDDYYDPYDSNLIEKTKKILNYSSYINDNNNNNFNRDNLSYLNKSDIYNKNYIPINYKFNKNKYNKNNLRYDILYDNFTPNIQTYKYNNNETDNDKHNKSNIISNKNKYWNNNKNSSKKNKNNYSLDNSIPINDNDNINNFYKIKNYEKLWIWF